MIINPLHETTLASLLKITFPDASGTSIKKWILHGMITVNGKAAGRPDMKVKPGDAVEYHKKREGESLPGMPFRIIYLDDDLVAVDKPAGLLTYGEKGTTGTSVYKLLTDYVRSLSGPASKVFVVHRLDREVSGVLLFARSEKIQEKIKENWSNTVKKYYALVEGHPDQKTGTISSWLKENRIGDVITVKDPEGAKWAITHYRVLREWEKYSLLEVTLGTGRKHQIRVQLAGIGCPVAGDRRYGADASFNRRIRLHAFCLQIGHPKTGENLKLESPMPEGFRTPGDRDENYKTFRR